MVQSVSSPRPHLSPEIVNKTPVVPKVDRTQVDPQLVEAAEGLEALFIDHMMQAMRKTVPKNEFSLNSPAVDIYQGMLDSEIAESAARTNSVGLADQIIAYMNQPRYNNNVRGNPLSTGGTHEGQSAEQPSNHSK